MKRIEACFSRLKDEGRKGFVAYLTAGDPSMEDTVDIVLRLAAAGVDLVELGVPFSDPLADGRVNQESAARALDAGTTLEVVLDGVRRIRAASDIPLVFYSYLNPLMAGGYAKTIRRIARAGVDGLLILDLTVEERGFLGALRSHDIDVIRLVTPTSTDERITRIVRAASGFVYCVSRTGVTGVRSDIAADAAEVVKRARRHTALPLALGFGISTPEQAGTVARMADAVVVGSAIVDRFHRAGTEPAARAAAVRWVKRMVKAVKDARP